MWKVLVIPETAVHLLAVSMFSLCFIRKCGVSSLKMLLSLLVLNLLAFCLQALLSSVKGIVVFLKGQERGSHTRPAATASRGMLQDGWCVYVHTAPSPAGGPEQEAQLQFAR